MLQALPSLLQNYAGSLTGDLLVAAFQVCFHLHGSKTAVVSNTAAATLQQLVLSSFEKVATENGQLQVLQTEEEGSNILETKALAKVPPLRCQLPMAPYQFTVLR